MNLRVQVQPGLQREIQDGQGYTEKSCLGQPQKSIGSLSLNLSVLIYITSEYLIYRVKR